MGGVCELHFNKRKTFQNPPPPQMHYNNGESQGDARLLLNTQINPPSTRQLICICLSASTIPNLFITVHVAISAEISPSPSVLLGSKMGSISLSLKEGGSLGTERKILGAARKEEVTRQVSYTMCTLRSRCQHRSFGLANPVI